mmetsp:Transcript_20669/g.39275  ORF Transcript_20669/g.39275 Transcript_20669/m.39275 type:complete len:499 (+) Transcript_20669:149-1645(+)|eukprot:CAMPEP_0114236680 /NCGR_PEP_ID=MMETSP0058-20121206/6975_1 /TAXON_ID=36894 /ORGANISM="Pyramimonas parkeae, CCMP726" /LENGTH=498 /DNA_ID=CAMNT_0001348649 /DNA_START=47 /DNA_END=1543 /DNA_ORIENTATION=+
MDGKDSPRSVKLRSVSMPLSQLKNPTSPISPLGKNAEHSTSSVMILPPETDQDQDQLSSAFEAVFINKNHQSFKRHSQPNLPHVSPSKTDQTFVECSTALKVLNISEFMNEGAKAIVDDSFTKCFKSTPQEPWNWNVYLFPMWVFGILIRYLVLFPIRLLVLVGGLTVGLSCFFVVSTVLSPSKLRRRLERSLTEFICSAFVASWTGVVKYHGPRPTPGANKVYVANHTSMIDFIILQQVCGHSVIMQKHGGWVGMLQSTILESIGCIQFDRTSMKDRALVGQRLKDHVQDVNKNPLLIFPEGTCVNNEFSVMFKKGAFDLGATVYPVAIKYNKIFVDAFWNSRRQSFSRHLLQLMTSWAVVCDVWYLEPQERLPEESPEQFAERVQEMICKKAGISKVPWDGMLKYYRPRPTLTEKRRKEFAKEVQECMVMESEEHDETDPDSEHQAELAASSSMKDQAVQKPEKRYRLPQQHAQDGVKRRHRSMGGKTAGFYLSMG